MQTETTPSTAKARRPFPLIVLAIATLCVITGAAGFGLWVGMKYQAMRMLYDLDQRTALITAFKRVVGLQATYADDGQDLMVILTIAPNKKNGYYVDVGSADGV